MCRSTNRGCNRDGKNSVERILKREIAFTETTKMDLRLIVPFSRVDGCRVLFWRRFLGRHHCETPTRLHLSSIKLGLPCYLEVAQTTVLHVVIIIGNNIRIRLRKKIGIQKPGAAHFNIGSIEMVRIISDGNHDFKCNIHNHFKSKIGYF